MSVRSVPLPLIHSLSQRFFPFQPNSVLALQHRPGTQQRCWGMEEMDRDHLPSWLSKETGMAEVLGLSHLGPRPASVPYCLLCELLRVTYPLWVSASSSVRQ